VGVGRRMEVGRGEENAKTSKSHGEYVGAAMKIFAVSIEGGSGRGGGQHNLSIFTIYFFRY